MKVYDVLLGKVVEKFIRNKIFRVIWSHTQQAWVVVSELVKSHTKTSTCTDKRAQVCTSDY
ncbi:ESPR domain-containing protein, partial [Glaesserella parasuis]|uniref:ESPR domain-containing protein n=1 Tax=Glaesserella parasuis TaxID=738 RepID=UPI003B7A76D5